MRARKELDDRVKAVKAQRMTLRERLAGVDDDRARAAAGMLAQRRPDLDALDRLLADADDADTDPGVAASRRLVTAWLPDVDAIRAVAADLTEANHAAAVVAASRAGAADRTARLLEEAVRYHNEHGDGPCPVCGSGTLDSAWHTNAAAELARLRAETAAANQAQRRLDDAHRRAVDALTTDRQLPTNAVDAASGVPEQERHQLRAALAAWRATSADAAPERLAEHLIAAYPGLHAAFTAVQAAAEDWLRQRHDAWREHAAELQTWLGEARTAVDDEATLARIKKARDWLKTATDQLRAARLAPFAKQSQEIWEQLRQESNVELSGMRLDGTATRRRVAFPATVDGTATSAMAVMSQGELQALGLAVFLPRACADDSPFRFLIIDDPVQSMDPSKVDGLAQVLAELAQTRQVVVFTHDNRLAETVRRLQIDATIWEVSRREGSEVEIRKNLDPVKRYLSDARALARTTELADEVRGPLVMSFCRSAIEAVCQERVRRERINRGEPHGAVEELIEAALTTTQIAALALYGSADQGAKVLPRLNQIGPWAADVFRACKEGAHGRYGGDLDRIVSDTERLVEKLR